MKMESCLCRLFGGAHVNVSVLPIKRLQILILLIATIGVILSIWELYSLKKRVEKYLALFRGWVFFGWNTMF